VTWVLKGSGAAQYGDEVKLRLAERVSARKVMASGAESKWVAAMDCKTVASSTRRSSARVAVRGNHAHERPNRRAEIIDLRMRKLGQDGADHETLSNQANLSSLRFWRKSQITFLVQS
jgi:hypothetical protein